MEYYNTRITSRVFWIAENYSSADGHLPFKVPMSRMRQIGLAYFDSY